MATRRRTITLDAGQAPQGGPNLAQLSEDELATWQMPLTPGGAQLPALQEDPDDTPEETATDRVQRMLSALAADDKAMVKLYRLTEGSSKQTWCEDYRPADFEAGGHGMIRRTWGPGTYMVRLYGQTVGKAGKPGFGLLTSSEITIAPRLDEPAPVNQAAGELGQVLRMMTEQQTAFQQQVLQALQHKPEAPDPMAQMTQMLSLMTMMRSAMGLDNQQPKSQIGEIIAAVRELRGAASELMPEKGGEGDESASGLLGQVLEAVKTVAPMVAARNQVPELPAPVYPMALPASMQPTSAPDAAALAAKAATSHEYGTVHEPAAQPTTEDPNETMRLQVIFQLKQALTPLLQLAANGASVDAGVDYVCDTLPAEVAELVEHPEAIPTILQFAPEAAPYAAWLAAVREAYLALEVEDDPADPAAPAAPAVVPPPAA